MTIFTQISLSMKKNMGTPDRLIRLLLAAVVGSLYATQVLTGPVAYVLLGLSAIFVLTSFVGFCPLYALFGFDTCPRKRVS